MRILIITYYYSPWLNPRAIRWTALVENLASQGNKVDVLCNTQKGSISTTKNSDINLYYTGKIKNLKNEVPKNKISTNKFFKKNIKALIIKFLKFVHHFTWKKVYWPDHACLWYFSAIKVGKKLLYKYQYDLIISVSLPYTSHLVALRLKHLRPDINWIVDIGDPFYFLDSTPTNNHKLYNKLNYYSEQKVLQFATKISVTNTVVLKMYKEYFTGCENKIHVIPPIFVSSNKEKKSFFSNSDKIILVYIGTLYKGIRSPIPLLKIFEKLLSTELNSKLELHIVGNITDCIEDFDKKYLNKKIYLHGIINPDEVARILNDNVFLINIGNKTSYQLPSKIVEYISSGNPIINIYSSHLDSSVEFLEKYPLTLNINHKLTNFNLDDVKRFIEKNNRKKISKKDINELLNPYKPNIVAEQYLSLCN